LWIDVLVLALVGLHTDEEVLRPFLLLVGEGLGALFAVRMEIADPVPRSTIASRVLRSV
jgi:hypothetical protein